MPPKRRARLNTEDVFDTRIRNLEDKIEALTNTKIITVPQYDPDNLPEQSVNGQIAVAHPDSTKYKKAYGFDQTNGWWTIGSPRTMIVIFNGNPLLTPGIAGDVTVHFTCDIKKWTLLGDISGDIAIDIWKASYAVFPPSVADTITAGAQPVLIGSAKNSDDTLPGWTTAITAEDTLRFNIDSVTDLSKVTLAIQLEG